MGDLQRLEPHDPYQGIINGNLTPFAQGSDELHDPPYHLAENIRRDVNEYIEKAGICQREDIPCPRHRIGPARRVFPGAVDSGDEKRGWKRARRGYGRPEKGYTFQDKRGRKEEPGKAAEREASRR